MTAWPITNRRGHPEGVRAHARWCSWSDAHPEAEARLSLVRELGETLWRREFDSLWAAAQTGATLPPATLATMPAGGRA